MYKELLKGILSENATSLGIAPLNQTVFKFHEQKQMQNIQWLRLILQNILKILEAEFGLKLASNMLLNCSHMLNAVQLD